MVLQQLAQEHALKKTTKKTFKTKQKK